MNDVLLRLDKCQSGGVAHEPQGRIIDSRAYRARLKLVSAQIGTHTRSRP